MRVNSKRTMGKKDTNFALFNGMNERERLLNKSELEQMYQAFEGIELPSIGNNNGINRNYGHPQAVTANHWCKNSSKLEQ